eukprot:1956685-Prymnesium_polylepis.1
MRCVVAGVAQSCGRTGGGVMHETSSRRLLAYLSVSGGRRKASGPRDAACTRACGVVACEECGGVWRVVAS